MNIQNVDHSISLIRTQLRQVRAALSKEVQEQGSLLIRARLFTWFNLARKRAVEEGFNPPLIVGAFWPLQYEPDLRPLLTQWAHAGVSVTLPIITKRDHPLEFHGWEPNTPLQSSRFCQALEPPARNQMYPDLLLVPTLGYTRHADRLGYGGGYYDRTLADWKKQNRKVTTIGLAWAETLLDNTYQPAVHDIRLDAILTSTGWVPAAP